METNDIFKKLREIINEVLEDQVEITESTALIGEYILDSLEFMNYISKVEEAFGIELSDEEIEVKLLGNIENMMNHLKSN